MNEHDVVEYTGTTYRDLRGARGIVLKVYPAGSQPYTDEAVVKVAFSSRSLMCVLSNLVLVEDGPCSESSG